MWNLNVLLVEDDAADTSLIMGVLKHHPDVASAQALDAPDVALRQLGAGRLRPDLVLLDVQMPKLNGFSFLAGMRHVPGMADTPVVFLTTSSLTKDVMRALDSSAALYVVKPDTLAELQFRLDGVIKRAVSGVWSH